MGPVNSRDLLPDGDKPVPAFVDSVIKGKHADFSMSGSADPAFKNVPKNTTCFIMWRVENMQLVPVAKEDHGQFFMGDSYLILVMKEHQGGRDMRIHFWLGKDTTQDEAGVAAIKAVDLDEYLGGAPVQYREVQGAESKTFLNYFKNRGGIQYKQGGVKSGFRKVEDSHHQKLLRVKGKITPRIEEMPSIGWEHMNDGDSFIVDGKSAIFIWFGKTCSKTERRRAMEYARGMRDDRGKGDLIAVEQGEEDKQPDNEKNMFDSLLPPSEKKKLLPADKAGSDEVVERKAAANLKLWKCSEEGASLKVTEIASKPLKKSMLDSGDTFIIDNGEAGIWIWIGKNSSPKERKEAMRNAQGFKKQKNYRESTQVIKVIEGGETFEFKALFSKWEKTILPGSVKPHSINKIAKVVQTKFDASTMHDNPKVASSTGMVDDGSGEKEIWRIEDFELKPLDKKYYGTLYAGDCYVILYTYYINTRPRYLLYYWLGKKSSQDEQGAAALQTVHLDDTRLRGAAVQVRVVQDKEPNHFMAIFGGKLIIYSGGKAGWGPDQKDGTGDVYLLHVRGTSLYNTKAQQVALKASSLNSNDCFALFCKTAVYVWAGKGSTGDEREMAKTIASTSSSSGHNEGYTMIQEGQENEDFWKLLGGKGEYASSPRLTEPDTETNPRLYQCSNASGKFLVEEIVDFVQRDLVIDDVFILDAVDNIWIWVGDEARPEEKTNAMQAAKEYLNTDPCGRDKDTPIYLIKQGYESPNFTGHFGVWDNEIWSSGKSFDELKEEMKKKNIGIKNIQESLQANGGEQKFSEIAKFTYEELTSAEPPEGVDLENKEKHLTEEDFEKVFGMKYLDFINLVEWKQIQLKKDLRLW